MEASNLYFWKLLVENPDAGVLQLPNGPYGKGSRDEALLILVHSYAAWYETLGAVDLLGGLGKAPKTTQ